MYNIRKIFAANIKRIRKNRSLTQEQFAETVGIQWKTVVNFESGRNLAGPENLQNICNKMKIAPYELFLTENENTSQDIIKKINSIMQTMSNKKLEELYRIVAVFNDKKHFIE